METIIVFGVLIISAIFIYFVTKETNKHLFSNPENVIKSYGSNKSCPNHFAVYYIKKSLEQNPNHPELTNKLKELENNTKQPTTIFLIMIGLMIVMPVIFWSFGKSHLYGLFLAVIIIVGGIVIYLQSIKKY